MRIVSSPVLALALGMAIALPLAGCAGTSRQIVGATRAPVAVESVRVFHQRPEGAVEIAYLESKSGMGFGTAGQRDAVIQRLRREAAALGANGLLLLGRGTDPSPVGLGVGVGSYGRNVGGGVSAGIPTTQERAHGIAIWVPEGE